MRSSRKLNVMRLQRESTLAGSLLRKSSTIVVFTLSLLTISFMARGEISENDRKIGVLLDRYATIAGGWHINQNCRHLSDELRQEFDWHVAQVNIATNKLLNNQRMLLSVLASARTTAYRKPFSDCGEETRGIVTATLEMARDTNKALTGQIYQKNVSRKQYLLEEFSAITSGMHFGEACNYFPPEIKLEVLQVYESVKQKLAQDSGDDAVKRAQENGKSKYLKTPECAEEAKKLFISSLAALRYLQSSLGLKETIRKQP